MRTIFPIILLFVTTTALAQKAANPEAYAKSITTNDLKKHLYIIAGADMEGRETGTPGQRKAAAYIEAQLKQMGLQPANKGSYQMFYNLYQDSITSATLEVNEAPFNMNTDFRALPTNAQASLRFSEVLLINTNSLDTLNTTNLAGRLVIVRSNISQAIINDLRQSKGVAGIIYVNPQFSTTVPPGLKSRQGIENFKPSIPPQQFVVSEKIARAIMGADYDKAENGASIKTYYANVLLEVDKTTLTVEGSNVMAILPGSDLKDEYLFITAHYDHLGKIGDSIIYYGADDDGSGTVALLELAEAFTKAKSSGKGPRRSIVFMAVSGEEKGLLGSAYYARHPVYPFDKTTADLNIDMIGRSDSSRKGDTVNYVYIVGDDKISSELKPLSEAVNRKYTRLELDYKFNDPNDKNRIYYRSDHYNFAKHGVPIIFYYDGMLGADYHKPTDTVEKINYPLLARRAKLVFYTAWEMANRPQMLKRDIPLK